MGSQLDIFIGPYIVVKGEKKVVLNKTVNTCSNQNCETYKTNQNYSSKQNFCAECGHAVKIKSYKEDKFYKAYDLYTNAQEHVDTLVYIDYQNNKQIFVGNHYSPFDLRKKINSYDFSEIDLRNINYEQEIEWFKEHYKNVIEFFENELGENSIEYKWGFVQWYD